MSEAKLKKADKYEIDMCNGPILSKLIVFSIPVLLQGILQLLFNAADIVVVGRFAGNTALAAVGATGSLVCLLLNLFWGLATGTNVLVARFYGCGSEKDVKETVSTSLYTAFFGGILLIFVGLFFSRPMLIMMSTPEDVLDQAVLYMQIYFAGMPAQLIFTYFAAVLRAVGDTKRPLYYLTLSGVVNVVLNLFFVVVLEWDVAGVALATVISQTVATILIVRLLFRLDTSYSLDLKNLKFSKDIFGKMMKFGIPSGLQGCVFSISNVLIQSSINSFGSVAVAGSTAGANLEDFVYTAMTSVYQAALSFSSQNYGTHNYKRIKKIMWYCLGLVAVVGIIFGDGCVLFANPLLRIYTKDPNVIAYGEIRILYICTLYLLCGLMDVMTGTLRGMGYTVMPMIVSLAGACGLRVIWIYTVFAKFHTLDVLFMSYPITWTVTFITHFICFSIVIRRKMRNSEQVIVEH
ncbi:MAG: MATE family efflux transporter [Lachnospiraceae bacterium]|nr:MATE family efflux transporter [Lachnospiraceae bacterium]